MRTYKHWLCVPTGAHVMFLSQNKDIYKSFEGFTKLLNGPDLLCLIFLSMAMSEATVKHLQLNFHCRGCLFSSNKSGNIFSHFKTSNVPKMTEYQCETTLILFLNFKTPPVWDKWGETD